ncbi:LOW QUALITY PROTEIN: 1-acylglycerol-3-phosphate O-acyltransferase Pnpla3 [Drosophila biarmipes]|uniref:LOW QUALITY PROTEIN: 1-acylglycerol-3-phosphate O-acyltransferase Pnpla3 n=1 Tax=Drosophila biarmipes TaxID=125945 RepID=UPI0021CC98B6|nr:LOW QUALITY PROTEIN: 1-acylglycerol-3-phosphate O-acyltransferase Pnpla3 [Drosophila biarmipes]
MKIRTRRSLSFAGCGFLGIYHVGVAVCLRQHAPQLLLERIAGASAGALAACCLICDLPMECMAGDFLRVVQETRRHSLGAFSPWFNLPECLLEGMHRRLPEDAHRRVSGRLHISLTRVSDRRNVLMSEFSSRQELLEALMCSCFIPGLSGLVPPQVRGVRYMDGAFSNNLPLLDEHTVTVSPFCGESDICPRDQNPHLLQLNINWANTCIRLSRRNLRRMVRILLPGRADFMANFCQQGYDDALHFLHRNSLLREGLRVKEGLMIAWIHQQEEREKLRAERARELERTHRNLKVMKHQGQQEKKPQDQMDKKRRNRRQKPQRRAKKKQEQAKQKQNTRNQEQSPQEGANNRTQENQPKDESHLSPQGQQHHQDHCAGSLISSTWSLLRRVMTAPPLARHMVQVIARRLSQSLTLCEQPHFDLALMQAPSSTSLCSPSRSTYCPPSTPLGDSDNAKVKAKRVCEASRVEVGDQVAEEAARSGDH